MNQDRQSIRHHGYDYSSGTFFVTICTNQQKPLFGGVQNSAFHANKLGKCVEDEWKKTLEIRDDVILDSFVVMPNHFHALLCVTGEKRVDAIQPNTESKSFTTQSRTLGAVIRGFKSAVTKRIREMTGDTKLVVWQRNYFEHVIRNEDDFYKTQRYILDNPIQWYRDRNNPDRKTN